MHVSQLNNLSNIQYTSIIKYIKKWMIMFPNIIYMDTI